MNNNACSLFDDKLSLTSTMWVKLMPPALYALYPSTHGQLEAFYPLTHLHSFRYVYMNLCNLTFLHVSK